MVLTAATGTQADNSINQAYPIPKEESKNLSAVTFTEMTTISLDGIFNGAVAWGDYDNDGNIDILVTGNNKTKIYKNNGDGTFSEQSGISLYSSYESDASWCDYNNDNFLDIFLSGYSYTEGYNSKIYKNNGDGTFSEQTGLSINGVRYGSSDWGDYDNNGTQDLLITGSYESGQMSKIYRNNGNNTFSELTNTGLPGVYYGTSSWGDYDNDNDLDILLTGYSDSYGYISRIYRNNGDDSFTEQTDITLTGTFQGEGAWGDYNNDGFLDILLTGFANTGRIIRIYKNNGNSTFTYQEDIAAFTNVNFSSAAWGDYDNDGNIDIIIAGEPGSAPVTKIYRNKGDGTFAPQDDIILRGVYNSSLAWGDYDNDGDLDILLAGYSSDYTAVTKIYRNDNEILNSPPGTPADLTVNTDGNKVAFSWSPVSDDFSPASAITYNIRVGTTPGGSEIVNSLSLGNGDLKIPTTGNAGAMNSFILKNMLLGTYYWSVQSIDNGFMGSTFSDEDTLLLEHMPPVVYSNEAKDTTVTGIFLSGSVNPNNDTTRVTFEWGTTTSYGDSLILTTELVPVVSFIEVSTAVNGLEPGTTYHWRIKAENSSGIAFSQDRTFITLPLYVNINAMLPGLYDSQASWGDYDNDGFLDILLSGYSYNTGYVSKVYRNGGDGSFTEQVSFALNGVNNCSNDWGDYNNDGYIDILLTGWNGEERVSRVYKNNGDGTFSRQTNIILTGISNGAATWEDFDNDGNLDVLLTGSSSTGYVTKIYKNNNDGTFTEQTSIVLSSVNQSTADWGDFNNDGYIDLLLTGYYDYYNRISKLYRNNGDATFTEKTDISLVPVYSGSAAWGDFNSDGYLDIIVTGISNDNVTKIYKNNGNETFTEQTGLSLTGVYNSSVVWGDYDNDGDPDILISGYSTVGSITRIIRNENDTTFIEQTNIVLEGINNGSAEWGDYDNDGDLDILITGSSQTVVFRNDLQNPGTVPETPGELNAGINGNDVTLSWKSGSDAGTPVKGLTYNVKIGTASGGRDIVSPNSMDSGKLTVPKMGNAQTDTTFIMKGMPWATYYWSVQAVDNRFLGSTFSSEGTFNTGPEVNTEYSAIHSADSVTLFGSADPKGFTTEAWFSYGLYDTAMLNTVAITQELLPDGGLQSVSASFSGITEGVTYYYQLSVKEEERVAKGSIETFNTMAPLLGSFTADHITVSGVRLVASVNPNGLSSSVVFEYGETPSLGLSVPGVPDPISGTSEVQVTANIESLNKNTTYYYRIIATNSNGSNYSAVKQFITECDDQILCNVPSGETSLCQGITESVYTTSSLTALSFTWEINPSSAGTISSAGNTCTVTWNSSFTGIAGIRVSGINGTCQSIWTNYLDVLVKDSPSSVDVTGSESVCHDQDNSIYSTVEIDGIEYSWSVLNGIINSGQGTPEINVKWGSTSAPGNVSLIQTLTSTGCSVTDIKTIDIGGAAPPPVPQIKKKGSINILICLEPEMEGYQWYKNEVAISGATGQYIVVRNNFGTYKVIITDSRGCYSQSGDVSVSSVAGAMTVWPNPSSGNFNIKLDCEETGNVLFKVIDAFGNVRHQENVLKSSDILTREIVPDRLQKGIYVLEAVVDGKKIENIKIVIL